MKALVLFYSRTGNTRRIAEEIAETINADIEELRDRKERKGILGFMLSGMDARLKRKANLKEIINNPALYDVVILGTPTWANTISTPIRTYIQHNSNSFEKVAFFVTSGFGRAKSALGISKDMANLCGKEPVAFLSLGIKDIDKEHCYQVEDFASIVKGRNKTS